MLMTDALLGEHGLFQSLFEHLRETMRAEGNDAELRGAAAALEAMLTSHAQLEEDLLFPALEPHLGQMGPLAVMRAEHEEIDRILETIRTAESHDLLCAVLRDLVALLKVHFQKEEMVLFGMARNFLDDETLSHLGDQWAERRAVTVDGQGCGGLQAAG